MAARYLDDPRSACPNSLHRLGAPAMKARNFRYIRPTSISDAYRILGESDGDAVPLAGGQSLLATLNLRLSSPKILVDLSSLKELGGQTVSDNFLRLGAFTLHRELLESELIRKH